MFSPARCASSFITSPGGDRKCRAYQHAFGIRAGAKLR